MSTETQSVRVAFSQLNQAQVLPVGGYGSVGIDIRGTFVGTFTFQASIDGENWTALPMVPLGSGANVATVTTTTTSGTWVGNVAGISQVRVLFSAYTSGTAVVTIRAEDDPAFVYTVPSGATTLTVGALPAGTNAIGDVGIQYRANATGAASVVSVLSPATPAGATIKGSAGRLLGWGLNNSSASVRSVKIFNATSVTMGTTSATFEIDIQPGASVWFNLEGGIGFATGIMWAVTAAKGLTDNTATGLAANDVSGAFFFA